MRLAALIVVATVAFGIYASEGDDEDCGASLGVLEVEPASLPEGVDLAAAGQNKVVVSRLPSCLDQDSIRVDGIGAATIFDVIYAPPSTAYQSEINHRTQGLRKQRAELLSERNVLERELAILDQYAGTLNAKDATSNQLGAFLDFYAEKKTGLNNSLAVLDDRISAVDKDIRIEQTASHADIDAHKLGVTVTIVVLAEEDGDAELSLSYTVSGASWTPLYDLRASIAGEAVSGKDMKSSVLLHYRASVSQKTGEAWDGVRLTLSTASPQLGTAIPVLRPLRVSEEVVLPVFERKSTRKGMRISTTHALDTPVRLELHSDAEDDARCITHAAMIPAVPAPLRMRAATVGEDAVSATFAIEGLSTIPSDTDDASQTHKVSITELTLSNIDLEWVTVPKEVSTVFLQASRLRLVVSSLTRHSQCKVKNTSDYPFLPGPASVYMGNSFVSRSYVPNVSPHEHLTMSLGADAAVRVTYHPQQKKIKQPTGSIFSTAKTSTTSYSQRISVKNTRRAAVPRLVVRDCVPNSTDARIKVNVVEPKELPSGGPASAAGVAKNDERPLDGDTGDGTLEWICAIPAGGEVDLGLAWDITAPAGVLWRVS
ncbi:hypothetical protein AURDEDRAFT_163847 [Auricularia subglabra TFB-10046 SS5]|nr:hypothetical protein AURDEDRAFT_163847 [Auricularia subglabra TFB-10046 SS5]